MFIEAAAVLVNQDLFLASRIRVLLPVLVKCVLDNTTNSAEKLFESCFRRIIQSFKSFSILPGWFENGINVLAALLLQQDLCARLCAAITWVYEWIRYHDKKYIQCRNKAFRSC